MQCIHVRVGQGIVLVKNHTLTTSCSQAAKVHLGNRRYFNMRQCKTRLPQQYAHRHTDCRPIERLHHPNVRSCRAREVYATAASGAPSAAFFRLTSRRSVCVPPPAAGERFGTASERRAPEISLTEVSGPFVIHARRRGIAVVHTATRSGRPQLACAGQLCARAFSHDAVLGHEAKETFRFGERRQISQNNLAQTHSSHSCPCVRRLCVWWFADAYGSFACFALVRPGIRSGALCYTRCCYQHGNSG